MLNVKSWLLVGLGSVIALVALVIVIVLPSSDDDCADQPTVSSTAPTSGGSGLSGEAAPPGGAPDRAAPGASISNAPAAVSTTAPGTYGPPIPNAPAAMVNPGPTAPGSGDPLAPIRRVWPLPAGTFHVTDPFGARGGTHMGVDFGAPDGTPIYSVAAGTVVAAGPASGFGNWIVIDSTDVNGRPFSAVYGHEWTSGVKVQVGQRVRAGQLIGAVGSAGESTGSHLHFEIVPGGRLTGGTQIDPLP